MFPAKTQGAQNFKRLFSPFSTWSCKKPQNLLIPLINSSHLIEYLPFFSPTSFSSFPVPKLLELISKQHL
uniref:Uncharacterized protein n=1 Tax=Kuenenia stuttgartiensis TaxID=174633 RepID=Q1PVU8_KUEST|nr:unknown protein [Candidatus Kuenenia stuttgartiensis]